MSPTEWGALDTLVSNSGKLSPKQIAEVTGSHPDSVRRGLDRIDGLVEREYSSVSLRWSYVAELVHDAVNQAREQTEWAVEAGAKALQAAERGLDENTSAFIAWAAKHGVNVKEAHDDISLKLGELPAEDHRREVRRVRRQGLSLWEKSRRDPITYRSGRHRYQTTEPEHDFRSVEAEGVTRVISRKVWEALG